MNVALAHFLHPKGTLVVYTDLPRRKYVAPRRGEEGWKRVWAKMKTIFLDATV
jgi:hypothetical protein